MFLFLCSIGSAETKVTYLPDGAVVVVFPSNLTVALESGGNPVIENQHRMHFKRKLIAPSKLVHRLEWRFYLRRKGRTKESVQKLGRRMRVGEGFSRHDSMLDSHEAAGYKEKALLVCLHTFASRYKLPVVFLSCHTSLSFCNRNVKENRSREQQRWRHWTDSY